MFTISESRAFIRTMEGVWGEGERSEFISWIAANPTAGDVIVGSGGLRKVRWSRPGQGKRGGVRIITYALAEDGQVWLLIGYTRPSSTTCPLNFW